jgi:hypothetical protein
MSGGRVPANRSMSSAPVIPMALALLLVALTVVLVALAVVGQDAGRRRTATAPVEILGIETRPSVFRGNPADSVIRYRFAAGSQWLERIATRTWSRSVIDTAQVCYEPADPANQVLVSRDASCP